MGTDGIEDYQQLGEKLDEAAAALKKSRRRGRRGEEAGAVVGGDVSMDAALAAGETVEAGGAGHPAEPIATGGKRRRGKGVVEAAIEAAAGGAEGTEAGGQGVVGEALVDGPVVVEAGGAEGPGEENVAEGKAKVVVDLVTLEALLFTTRHPLTSQRLGEMIDIPSAKALRNAIAELNTQYEATGRSFRIEQVAGGYQMLTLPEHGPMLNRLYQREIDSKLSRSALETLSIVAYKQPVLRAEVEAIRGVASGETIRNLMEKHLVKIAGRAEEPGRPILYGTTKRFLEVFGLNSLKELPKDEGAGGGKGKPVAREVIEREVVQISVVPEGPGEVVAGKVEEAHVVVDAGAGVVEAEGV